MHPLVDLGLIPSFFHESDPRPAKEQIADRYSYGGGWTPLDGFVMNEEDHSIQYISKSLDEGEEQDPPLRVLAEAQFRDEKLYFYPHAWLAIVQPDGSFEVSRLD